MTVYDDLTNYMEETKEDLISNKIWKKISSRTKNLGGNLVGLVSCWLWIKLVTCMQVNKKAFFHELAFRLKEVHDTCLKPFSKPK